MTEKQYKTMREKQQKTIEKLAKKDGVTPELERSMLLERAKDRTIERVIAERSTAKNLRIIAALYMGAAIIVFMFGKFMLACALFVAALVSMALAI